VITFSFLVKQIHKAPQKGRGNMKVVPLNEVKNQLPTYLEMSKREDIVVTKNGRPAAVLHGVTDKDFEGA
jgi:prevent-host-death family protein